VAWRWQLSWSYDINRKYYLAFSGSCRPWIFILQICQMCRFSFKNNKIKAERKISWTKNRRWNNLLSPIWKCLPWSAINIKLLSHITNRGRIFKYSILFYFPCQISEHHSIYGKYKDSHSVISFGGIYRNNIFHLPPLPAVL
jgi:hypothetical protein